MMGGDSADPPPGATLLAVVEKGEAEFGYVGTGTVGERMHNVRLQFSLRSRQKPVYRRCSTSSYHSLAAARARLLWVK